MFGMRLFSSRITRPVDVFADPFLVFDITDREVMKTIVIEQLAKMKLNKSYIYNRSGDYEILFKRHRIYYSIFRCHNQNEAEEVFNRIKINMLTMIKIFVKQRQKKFVTHLYKTAKLCNENPGWSFAHLAAHLEMYHAFKNEVALITDHLNSQAHPQAKTPLHVAIERQHLPTIKSIVALKPHFETQDASGNTILHSAAATNLQVFQYLWTLRETHQLMDKRNVEGFLPMHIACYQKRPEIVRRMLMNGVTVSQMIIVPSVVAKSLAEKEIAEKANGSYREGQVFRFDDEMIRDLDTSDMMLGGTPLHWVTQRRTLEKLLFMKIKTSYPNSRFERPIHILTRRHRFRCQLGLLAFDSNVVYHNNQMRQTALHYAVHHEDISEIQALLVFDADKDAIDKNGRSARHFAAAKRSTVYDMIVYILDAVGAKRCPKGFPGCKPGCSADGTFNGIPYEKWSNFKDETLYKKMLLEQIIQDARRKKQAETIARSKSSPLEDTILDNPVPPPKKSAVMLSLDGGGSRGLITCTILVELANMLKYPLFNYFDWTIGTSTGGIIGALLNLRMSPQEIRKVYFTFKDRLISGSRPYSSDMFENILKQYIGEKRFMSEFPGHPHSKLILTGTLTDRIPHQLHLFRSYESFFEICNLNISSKQFKPLPNCHAQQMWSACRASGAAPTFFRVHGVFIDGGLIANNPTLDGLAEFAMHNESLRVMNRESESQDLSLVISIGTGKVPVIPRESDLDMESLANYNPMKYVKKARVIKDLMTMILDEATNADGHVVDRAMAACYGMKTPLFRISSPLSEDLPLDVTDETEVINGMWETQAYMYAMRNQLTALVELLELAYPPEANCLKYVKPATNFFKISELVSAVEVEEAKKVEPQDDVKDTLIDTKNFVKNLIKRKSPAVNETPVRANYDYSTEASDSTNDGDDDVVTIRTVADGPPASASENVTPMSSSDVRRDLAADFKQRNTVLMKPQ